MPEEEAVYQERPGGARRVLRAQGRYFGLPAFLISARRTLIALAQVRHGMVEKKPNPCRMSSGNSWVYTTFAIELETLR